MQGKKDSPADFDLDVLGARAPAAADSPVHVPMTDRMNVDLMINRDSRVWLAHDRPFPGILQWVEYDVDAQSLVFVTSDGKTQDLGLTIHPPLRKYLRLATTIDTILYRDKKIQDFYSVPLVVRETMN